MSERLYEVSERAEIKPNLVAVVTLSVVCLSNVSPSQYIFWLVDATEVELTNCGFVLKTFRANLSEPRLKLKTFFSTTISELLTISAVKLPSESETITVAADAVIGGWSGSPLLFATVPESLIPPLSIYQIAAREPVPAVSTPAPLSAAPAADEETDEEANVHRP